MQPYINSHQVVGNLGDDAKIVPLKGDGGTPRFAVNLRIAATRHRKGVERTTWFNVSLYVNQAGVDYFRDVLKKGTRVFVEGEDLEDEGRRADGSRQTFRYIQARTVIPFTSSNRRVQEQVAPVMDDRFQGWEPSSEQTAQAPVQPMPPSAPAPMPPPSSTAHHPAPMRVASVRHELPEDANKRFDVVDW